MPSEPDKYEKRDANVSWIVAIVIGLFICGLSIHGILAGFLARLKNTPYPSDNWRPIARMQKETPVRPPFPALQVSSSMDLQAFRTREEAELNSYGWVSRTNGIVRVPIERAMELVLQQGLPTRTGTNQGKAGPSTYQLMQQRPEHREPEIKGEK